MDLQVVWDQLQQVVRDILAVVPDVINGLIVFVVGYALAWVTRLIVRFILSRSGFDTLMEDTGLAHGLRRFGVPTPLSRLVSQTVFLLILLSFAITAARLMRLEAVSALLEQVLAYLPNAVAALIVFLVGSLGATFAGDNITRLGRTSRLAFAATLGSIIQLALILFVIVLALGVLGVNTSILVTILTIFAAAFGLTISLAVGLGGRALVGDILASYYVRERFPVGQRIALSNVEGEVQSIGGVNTVITVGEELIVVPNSTLIKRLVRTRPAATSPAETPPTPPATP
ncbi:MAG: mechanosensitive ion channel [Chloroflexales bacterium]|nr:mechanosensitive ion channel [Chloroflexales bacterium]